VAGLRASESWVLPVDAEGFITLPQECLDAMGWVPGDVLEFETLSDGAIHLRKRRQPLTKVKQEKRKPKRRKFVVDPDTKEIEIIETQRFLKLTDEDLDSAWNQLMRPPENEEQDPFKE
jgi:bifunctional DNA-binding transcriptional regulator/antitoxin component of YhaV-PrlF toxin-antitoxin module